jgi:protein gp37
VNKTSIEWTDFSANPLKLRDLSGRVVWGCVHASPGCVNCYAETLARRYRRGEAFTAQNMNGLTPFLSEDELRRMLTYKPAAGKRCFVGDMTDVFGEWVPDALLDQMFAVFAIRSDVAWQVLTKRSDRLRAYMAHPEREAYWMDAAAWALETLGVLDGSVKGSRPELDVIFRRTEPWLPLPNVWLGVSCEDQRRADERIPALLETPAAVRFVSAEPLLGPIDMHEYLDWWGGPAYSVSWVIVGGESGPNSRRCDRAWVQSIVEQCASAKVPAFVKQLGSNVIDRNDAGFMGDDETAWPEEIAERDAVEHDLDGTRDGYQGAPVRVRLKSGKGGDPAEWPEVLRVREFPTVTA